MIDLNLVSKIKQGKINITINLQKFADNEKVKQMGKITLADFVKSIEDSDPFEIVHLYDNFYILHDKKETLHLVLFTDRKNQLLLKPYFDYIRKIYPELKKFMDEYKLADGCKACTEDSYSIFIFECICALGGKDRENLNLLEPLFGETFIEKLAITESDRVRNINFLIQRAIERRLIKPKNGSNIAVKKEKKPCGCGKKESSLTPKPTDKKENHFIHQCLFCTLEHIGKAQRYFGEYLKNKQLYRVNWAQSLTELACAELECIQINNELSQKIRDEKKKMETGFLDNLYYPDFDYLLNEAMDAI